MASKRKSHRRTVDAEPLSDHGVDDSMWSWDTDSQRRLVAGALVDRTLASPALDPEEAERLQNKAWDCFWCGSPIPRRDPNGVKRVVWQSCDNPDLCRRCAGKLARKTAALDAAKIERIHAQHPSLRFVTGRFSMRDDDNLYRQCKALLDRFGAYCQSNAFPWSNILGARAQVHPERSWNRRRWRSHVHFLFVVIDDISEQFVTWFSKALGLRIVEREHRSVVGRRRDEEWYFRELPDFGKRVRPDLLLELCLAPETRGYRESKYAANRLVDEVDDRVAIYWALRVENSVRTRRTYGLFGGGDRKELIARGRLIGDVASGSASGSLLLHKGLTPPATLPSPPNAHELNRQRKREEHTLAMFERLSKAIVARSATKPKKLTMSGREANAKPNGTPIAKTSQRSETSVSSKQPLEPKRLTVQSTIAKGPTPKTPARKRQTPESKRSR